MIALESSHVSKFTTISEISKLCALKVKNVIVVSSSRRDGNFL